MYAYRKPIHTEAVSSFTLSLTQKEIDDWFYIGVMLAQSFAHSHTEIKKKAAAAAEKKGKKNTHSLFGRA